MYYFDKKLDNWTVKIDMRHLTAQGFQYSMHMDGKLFCDYGEVALYSIGADCLTVTYTDESSGAWGFVKKEIPIDWQSAQYGKKGAHFLCPVCKEKTMTLYNDDVVSFICGKCCKRIDKLPPLIAKEPELSTVQNKTMY